MSDTRGVVRPRVDAVPWLHAITDDARLADARFVADATAVLEAGGAALALHLRGRSTSAGRLFELATVLLPVARAARATLLVNDRVDVALAARAHGVQLPERGIGAAHARTILGDGALIGVSRHAATIGTGAAGADFVVWGSVYATASHPDRTPGGIEGLREMAQSLAALSSGGAQGGPHPAAPRLIAIGGIVPGRVAAVVAAGAVGVAALGGIWTPAAGGPAEAVRAYLSMRAGGIDTRPNG